MYYLLTSINTTSINTHPLPSHNTHPLSPHTLSHHTPSLKHTHSLSWIAIDLAGIFVVLAAAMILGVLVEMFPFPSCGLSPSRQRTPHMVRNLVKKVFRTGNLDPDIDPINRDDGAFRAVESGGGGLDRNSSRTFLARVGSKRVQGGLERGNNTRQLPQQQQQRSQQRTTTNRRDDDDDEDDHIPMNSRNNDVDSDYGSQSAPVEQESYASWAGASIVGMFYPAKNGLDLAPLNQQQQKQQQQQRPQQQQQQPHQEKGTRASSRKQVDDWLFGVEGPLPYRGEED